MSKITDLTHNVTGGYRVDNLVKELANKRQLIVIDYFKLLPDYNFYNVNGELIDKIYVTQKPSEYLLNDIKNSVVLIVSHQALVEQSILLHDKSYEQALSKYSKAMSKYNNRLILM